MLTFGPQGLLAKAKPINHQTEQEKFVLYLHRKINLCKQPMRLCHSAEELFELQMLEMLCDQFQIQIGSQQIQYQIESVKRGRQDLRLETNCIRRKNVNHRHPK